MNMKARLFQSFDHAQPHRPDRIDQYVGFVGLNQERGVADPGDANLARLDLGKQRTRAGPGASGKKRRDPYAGDEIAFGPIAAWTKFYSLRFLRAGLLRVANNLTLSRKRIRHWAEPYKRGSPNQTERYLEKNKRMRAERLRGGNGGGRQTKTP